MRLVDKNYKPLPKEHQFVDGEKARVSHDTLACFDFTVVRVENGRPFVDGLPIFWGYSSPIRDFTWIIQPKISTVGNAVQFYVQTEWERKTLLANGFKPSAEENIMFSTAENADYIARMVKKGGVG